MPRPGTDMYTNLWRFTVATFIWIVIFTVKLVFELNWLLWAECLQVWCFSLEYLIQELYSLDLKCSFFKYKVWTCCALFEPSLGNSQPKWSTKLQLVQTKAPGAVCAREKSAVSIRRGSYTHVPQVNKTGFHHTSFWGLLWIVSVILQVFIQFLWVLNWFQYLTFHWLRITVGVVHFASLTFNRWPVELGLRAAYWIDLLFLHGTANRLVLVFINYQCWFDRPGLAPVWNLNSVSTVNMTL